LFHVSALQVILIFLVTFIAAIDQFSLLQSLYQPIVMGLVIGAILGDVRTGLIVGGTYQLMTIGNMPVGGAQPPNAVIGGIMAVIFAITSGLTPTAAVAAAVPFALLGQYGVTLLFSAMSPAMGIADRYAEDANPRGIDRLNYIAMAILGGIFAIIVTLFFIGGAAFGERIVAAIPEWLMTGLSAAGGMMRFVGFAILIRVMVSRELWGFFFIGFALAVLVSAIPTLAGAALIILTLIGFALAYWDFQIQTKFKTAAVAPVSGDYEDGI